jgi:hypothetical protein
MKLAARPSNLRVTHSRPQCDCDDANFLEPNSEIRPPCASPLVIDSLALCLASLPTSLQRH